jgi:acetolactate synthase-1/2/3 large subunit
MTVHRDGAYVLLKAAQTLGVRVCFANPGTTELTLVRALDEVPNLRPVLALFEGVCTGAADGYARISGVPALTLLHLGPGLANGLANLHNARRAHSPLINIVGDHATWHLPFDAPLTSDIESLARPMSDAISRLESATSIQSAMRTAVEQAMGGTVVTLIAPTDVMDAPVLDGPQESMSTAPQRTVPTVPASRIAECAARLANVESLVLLLGADGLTERSQRAAARVAESTGARLLMESYPAVVPLGGDLPRLERLAYFPSDVLAQLGDATVLLAGARTPVSYFGYENQPSVLVPSTRLIQLSAPGENSELALQQLSESLSGDGQPRVAEPTLSTPPRTSSLTPSEVAEELVALIPEGTIISLEGSTCGGPYLQQAYRARRHWVMTNTGGAIGQGLPCAVGAAIARPEVRIVCLQSDGSAQYTLQALWTMAREHLNITVIICANHRYGILQTELRRAGAQLNRPALERLTRIDSPRLDWVSLARGYGVPGVCTSTSSEFSGVLRDALAVTGPYLIQAELE